MKMSAVMAVVTLAAAVVFSLANPAKAQQGHAIPIQVQPGQTFLLDMSYAVGGAAGVGSFDMTLALGLEIEEMGPQGGVWRWSVEDIGFDLKSMAGGAAALNPLAAGPAGPGFNQAVSAGLRLMTDLDIVCRVDARGACVEVLNWPQWRERAENAVLLVTGVLRFLDEQQQFQAEAERRGSLFAPEPKPDYVPSSRLGRGDAAPALPPSTPSAPGQAPFGPIAGGVEAVAGVLLDNIDGRILAGMTNILAITDVQGLALAEGQTIQTESVAALPFGAEPFRVAGVVTLESLDRRAGVARFSRAAAVDPVAVSRSLTTLLQNGVPPILDALSPLLSAVPMRDLPPAVADDMVSMLASALQDVNLQMEDTSTAEVDLATGLVRSGRVVQTVSLLMPDGLSALEQATTMTFTLRPAPLNQARLGAAAVR
jgi:hypothetical protein